MTPIRLVLAALLAAAPAIAQPRRDAPPPSTGQELHHGAPPPQLAAERAKALRDQAVARFKSPSPDCGAILRDLSLAFANGAGDPVNAESEPSLIAFVRCAARLGRWTSVYRMMNAVLQADPKFPEPGLLPKAAVMLGDYDAALTISAALAKDHPNDPEIAFAAAAATCRLERWPECEAQTGRVRKMIAGQATPDARAYTMLSHVLLGEAYFHTGRFDQSTRELEQLPPGSETIEKRLKRNAIVKSSKLAVEPDYDPQVPLGIYHLLGQIPSVRPLLTLKLYDFDAQDRQVRLEVEVPGVTEKVVKTKLLAKGRRELVPLTPPLKGDFPLARQRADRPAQLAIKVTALDPGGEKVLYEKSYPITLLPRDTLPLSQHVAADELKPTPGFIAAWVTPNAQAIDQFLQTAKKGVDQGPFSGAFTGEQHATLPQVRALWNELQREGVSYVMDPEVLSDFGLTQRTRLPSEVLASKNAQCLEGTILFATLMEAIGLRPILVHVPGHAFVGWHPSAEDKEDKDTLYFVETTMVHSAKFDDAMRFSARMVESEMRAGHFKSGLLGQSYMLDLAQLRKQGFKPQPIE